MRAILPCLLAALILSACNQVHSVEPLVMGQNGAPPLREGLWVSADRDCAFEAGKPLDQWPDCADPVEVSGGKFTGVREKDKDGLISFSLEGRDPAIMQLRVEQDAGGAAPSDDEEKLGRYFYYGLEARRLDEQGRIVEAALWPALCGPPPASPGKGRHKQYVTRHPLPGMTIVGDNCRADRLSAVRRAAAESRKWSQAQSIHWVRDLP